MCWRSWHSWRCWYCWRSWRCCMLWCLHLPNKWDGEMVPAHTPAMAQQACSVLPRAGQGCFTLLGVPMHACPPTLRQQPAAPSRECAAPPALLEWLSRLDPPALPGLPPALPPCTASSGPPVPHCLSQGHPAERGCRHHWPAGQQHGRHSRTTEGHPSHPGRQDVTDRIERTYRKIETLADSTKRGWPHARPHPPVTHPVIVGHILSWWDTSCHGGTHPVMVGQCRIPALDTQCRIPALDTAPQARRTQARLAQGCLQR